MKTLFPRLIQRMLLTCLVLMSLWLCIQQSMAAPDEAIPDGVTVESNVVYGKGGDQPLILDLSRPKEGKGPFPALVFVHGGGWMEGSRDSFRSPMLYFSTKGIVCITIDYRLAPKYPFPAQIEDAKCAVRWMRANAKKYNVDPKRIGAVGASAGAHLVAMLGTTAGDKRWEGNGGNPKQSSAISAMICISGPYDLTLGYSHSTSQNANEGAAVRSMLASFLGGTPEKVPAQYRNASPMSFVNKNTVPALLTHGTADTLVPIEQSDLFYQKLKDTGIDVELMRIDGAGHGDFGKKPGDVLDKCTAFIQKYLLR